MRKQCELGEIVKTKCVKCDNKRQSGCCFN